MIESVDIQVIVTGIVGLITTATSGWVSWLFAKKKYNAEVDTNIIGNMNESLKFYEELSNDNKKRLEEVLGRNNLLEEEIREVRKQIFELMNNICYNLTCKLRVMQPNESKAIKEDKDHD